MKLKLLIILVLLSAGCIGGEDKPEPESDITKPVELLNFKTIERSVEVPRDAIIELEIYETNNVDETNFICENFDFNGPGFERCRPEINYYYFYEVIISHENLTIECLPSKPYERFVDYSSPPSVEFSETYFKSKNITTESDRSNFIREQFLNYTRYEVKYTTYMEDGVLRNEADCRTFRIMDLAEITGDMITGVNESG